MVAIPTKAATHIQKSAPGPPILMAMATPEIFPNPTVEAMADINACLEVISPGANLSSYFPFNSSIACPILVSGTKPEWIKKKVPPPKSKIKIGGPQIQLLKMMMPSSKALFFLVSQVTLGDL